MLRLARKVALRSRCLEVTCEIGWYLARFLTPATSVRLEHRDLPGGEQYGKVLSVELELDGKGKRIGRIRVGVMPGFNARLGAPAADQDEAGNGAFSKVVYKVNAPAPRDPVNAYTMGAK